MHKNNEARDWAKRFQINSHARCLTLSDVARMSACREHDGWYVARCDGSWILGRRSDRRHYPVVIGGEPMAFDSMPKALRYLRALLSPTMQDAQSGLRDLRVEVTHTADA